MTQVPIHIHSVAMLDEWLQGDGYYLLEFQAPWCTSCRAVQPLLLQLSERYSGRLPVLAINADDHPQLAERFAVRSLPLTLLMQGADVLERLPGVLPLSQLERLVQPYLSAGAWEEDRTDDVDALRRLADQYPDDADRQTVLLNALMRHAANDECALYEVQKRLSALSSAQLRHPELARLLSFLQVWQGFQERGDADAARQWLVGEADRVAGEELQHWLTSGAAEREQSRNWIIGILNAMPDRRLAHEFRRKMLVD